MKKTVKSILAGIFLFTLVSSAYSQSYSDDEMTYEPIHATLIPSTLNVEENYTKDYRVYFSGDDIVFNTINTKSPLTARSTIKFTLPVNPKQDYEMEFTFTLPLKSEYSMGLGVGSVAVGFTKKSYSMISGGGNVVAGSGNKKKWKLPETGTKGQLKVNIERRNKIISVFANGEYLGEVNDAKSTLQEMPVAINFFGFNKKEAMSFNAVRVDQGIENE